MGGLWLNHVFFVSRLIFLFAFHTFYFLLFFYLVLSFRALEVFCSSFFYSVQLSVYGSETDTVFNRFSYQV